MAAEISELRLGVWHLLSFLSMEKEDTLPSICCSNQVIFVEARGRTTALGFGVESVLVIISQDPVRFCRVI